MNKDKSLGITIVPRLYLIKENVSYINRITSEAFGFADSAERKMLFNTRAVLADILPKSHTDFLTAEEYVTALEVISRYLLQSYNMPFPGIIPADNYSDTQVSRILRISNNITLYCTDNDSCENTLRFLTSSINVNIDTETEFNIIAKRNIPSKITEQLYKLWNTGISVSISNEYTAQAILSCTFSEQDSSYDVVNGIPMIPGKSLTRFERLNPNDVLDTNDEIFRRMLKKLTFVLEEEVQSRFRRNAKGRSVYKNNRDIDELTPYIPYYDKCISNADKTVRGILHGGAEHDFIAVTTDSPSNLPFLAAACKYCESLYPIKAVPYYNDKYTSKTTEDVYNIIRNHSEVAEAAYGGSSLEISLPKITKDEFRNIITVFMTTRGVTIKIIKQV